MVVVVMVTVAVSSFLFVARVHEKGNLYLKSHEIHCLGMIYKAGDIF